MRGDILRLQIYWGADKARLPEELRPELVSSTENTHHRYMADPPLRASLNLRGLQPLRILSDAWAFTSTGFAEKLIWSLPLVLAHIVSRIATELSVFSEGSWIDAATLPVLAYLLVPLQVAVTRGILLGEQEIPTFFALLGSRRTWRAFLAMLKAAIPLVPFLLIIGVLSRTGLSVIGFYAAMVIPAVIVIYCASRLAFVGIYPALDGPITLKASWHDMEGKVLPLVVISICIGLAMKVPEFFIRSLIKGTLSSGPLSIAVKIAGSIVWEFWEFVGCVVTAAALALAYRDWARFQTM